MTETSKGRMLLSHNYNISPDILPELTKEEFTTVFKEGLSNNKNLASRQVNNPHWIVEILFATAELSPPQVGEMLGQALLEKRLTQKKPERTMPDLLILGGMKTTPATSSSPEALQTGEWGVDVVETASAEQFLLSIGWETAIANKSIENIFKIEIRNSH